MVANSEDLNVVKWCSSADLRRQWTMQCFVETTWSQQCRINEIWSAGSSQNIHAYNNYTSQL